MPFISDVSSVADLKDVIVDLIKDVRVGAITSSVTKFGPASVFNTAGTR